MVIKMRKKKTSKKDKEIKEEVLVEKTEIGDVLKLVADENNPN